MTMENSGIESARRKDVADLTFCLLLLAIAAFAFWQARDWPSAAKLFPSSVAVVLALLVLIQVGKILRGWLANSPSVPPAEHPWQDVPREVVRRKLLEALTAPLGLALLIVALGFVAGCAIGTGVFLLVVARIRLLTAVGAAIGVAVFLRLVEQLLSIPLPGPLLFAGF